MARMPVASCDSNSEEIPRIRSGLFRQGLRVFPAQVGEEAGGVGDVGRLVGTHLADGRGGEVGRVGFHHQLVRRVIPGDLLEGARILESDDTGKGDSPAALGKLFGFIRRSSKAVYHHQPVAITVGLQQFDAVRKRLATVDDQRFFAGAVNQHKRRRIIRAAKNFIAESRAEQVPARFDVVAIVAGENAQPEITHFVNAFTADATK
jgi:hypothetical protein